MALVDEREIICLLYTLKALIADVQGPLLLTWFNFNSSMDK